MRYFVAGHRGMVGSAICRRLTARGDEVITRSRAQLDLRDQRAVGQFLLGAKPDAVILAAARVGGIHANNSYPADFIYENLMIECNVVHQSHLAGIERLLFLGSSCIYPRDAAQPIREEALLTGPLEATNEPYAVAKIAGLKLCESYNRQHGTDFRAVMPTNLYGPGDNFHPENSHVLPALMRRFHEAARQNAPEVVIWGSGMPRREFLHVDDM
ncbi:GDP-L-fucose synthase, partial [Thioclava sp. BHET1]